MERNLIPETYITNDDIKQSSMDIEKLELAVLSMKGNLRLYTKLKKVTPKPAIDTIISINNNKFLMGKFIANRCKHFSSLKEAVDAMCDDNILVYIVEIYLYGVFTIAEYLEFIGKISEDDDNNSVPYTPKQITLSGFPQRVIFMCSGEKAVVERVKNYCEVHFKSHVQVNTVGDKTDVIIQSPIVNNFEESKRLFKNFVAYVSDREDINAMNLRQDVKVDCNVDYMVNSLLSEHMKACKPDQLLKFLHGVPISLTLNINNGGIQIIGNHNKIINPNKQKNTQKDKAIDWIKSNLPKFKEKKTEYYRRYTDTTKDPLSEIVFAKLVPDNAGCTSKKTNGYTYWVFE